MIRGAEWVGYYGSLAAGGTVQVLSDESGMLVLHEAVIVLVELEVATPEWEGRYLQMRTMS